MAGSGFGAFQIDTPSQSLAAAAQAQSAAAQAQSAASRSALEAATLPDEIAMSGIKRDASALELADKRKASTAKDVATNEALIANAAALATDADSWDRAMQALVDKGVDEARQFIGRFSTSLQQRVAAAYGAATPTAALGAMSGSGDTPLSGLEAAGAPPAAQAADLQRMFGNMAPEQLKASYDHLEKMRAAIVAVENAKDPGAEWNAQARMLGMADQVGGYSPAALAQLKQDVIPVDTYLRSRLTQQSAGLPAPLAPAGETKEVGGVLYERDPVSGQWNAKTPRISTLGADQQIVGIDPATATQGPVSLSDWSSKMQLSENDTGDPNAKNPKSSATGNGQFVDQTWRDLVKANRPDLAKGKTDAQILAMRSDPALSGDMTQAYARDNGVALNAAGDPVNGATLAMAHRVGLDGAKAVLASSPDTPMSAVLSDAAMKANPQYANMTTGDFSRDMVKKFGADAVAIPGLPQGHSVPSGVPGVKILASGSLMTDGANRLSPEATDFIAETYLRTGQLPPLGMGKAATQNRDVILNRAAEMEQETGKTGGDAVLAWSNLKADRAALSNLAKQSDMIKAFEGTAEANADQVLKLAPKGVGGSAPVFNRWINAGRRELAGDPDVTKFNTAIGTFADEYAKVVSGGTGSQAVTDSSRAEAYSRINSSQTLQQLQGNIAQMKIEMGNRRTSLDSQRQAIEGRISGAAAPPSAAQATAPAAQVPMRGGYPVLTPEQAQSWAQAPGNKGKKFYATDGRLLAFR